MYNAEVGNYYGMNILNVPDWVFDQLTFTGVNTIDAASQKYIMESFRLVANETRGGYVVLSTGQKLPYLALMATRSTGALGNYISIYIAISALIEAADGDEDDLAAIAAMEQVGGTLTDQFTIEMDWGDEPTGLSGGDDAHNLASFFNITEATEYTALTPAEAIAIARDCQYNVMGTDWPIPTWLPTGVTEAQVESAAEGLGIPYHEPTQTA